MAFNVGDAVDYLNTEWTSVIGKLKEYIAIKNTSINYNYDIVEARNAAHLLKEWAGKRGIPNIKAEVHDTYDTDGRAPVILVTIEGTKANPADVFIYGHYDKQPPMYEGWVEPHPNPYIPYEDPVTKYLYGRGGADDGYSIFAAITSIEVLWDQKLPYDRYVILIEGAEESGSKGLELYLEEFAPIIRTPSLIICLDSGCGNYDQLWLTTSLRGFLNGNLRAAILTEDAHSGSASGIVASSFHIQRILIDRLEADHTGVVYFNKLTQEITEDIKNQAKNLAELLGTSVYDKFKYVPNGQPVDKANIDTMIINSTYRPTLCVVGVGADIPLIGSGDTGNVVRKSTTFMLSVRLPPAKDAKQAALDLKAELERDPPYGADVLYEPGASGSGWQASTDLGWLKESLTNANHNFFSKTSDFVTQGEGGSIPFIGMLATKFPQAKFVVTGVLGPGSNAHGPNEFLHTEYAKKVTGCVANILYDLSLQK